MDLNSTSKQALSANQLLDAALEYAAIGWQVLPIHSIQDGCCSCGKPVCSSPGKHPHTLNGLKDATTESNQIRDWWRKWSDANVGIRTGTESSILVIDVDARHGGFESLKKMQAELGELPVTVEAVTGGGGCHIFFKHPGGILRNRTNLRPGIDVRADNGYVLAPPSNHISGKPYRWDEARAPGECLIADLPPWLLSEVTSEPPKRETNGVSTGGNDLFLQRAMAYIVKAAPAAQGERNNAAFNLAGNLAAFTDTNGSRLTETEISNLLRAWNVRNSPPLDDSELIQCVLSATQNGTARSEKLVIPGGMPRLTFATRAGRGIEKYTFGELRAKYPTLHPPVIDGICREGETVNIISTSKIGKSWLAYNLALSIITGRPWLERFPTAEGKVLYIDNELHKATIANRIPAVAEAMGLFPDDYMSKLDIWPLRGNLKSLPEVRSELLPLERGTYKAIIFDAKYRFGNGESENDNAAETMLYNLLDQIAEQTGATLILIHHSSKGSQSDKRVTDVGAGAGAQSRAADCHLVLREHKEDGVVVLDAAVRSFKPVKPLSLRWEFPLWVLDDNDPEKLKGTQTKQQLRQQHDDKEGRDAILKALQKERLSTKKILAKAQLGRSRAERLLGLLEEEGSIKSEQGKVGGNRCTVYSLNRATEGGGP